MKVELYHRWECPYSAKVRNFINENNLTSQISFIEIDETPDAQDELNQHEGKTQTPCLVVDGKPILESKKIIEWMELNLVIKSRDQAAI